LETFLLLFSANLVSFLLRLGESPLRQYRFFSKWVIRVAALFPPLIYDLTLLRSFSSFFNFVPRVTGLSISFPPLQLFFLSLFLSVLVLAEGHGPSSQHPLHAFSVIFLGGLRRRIRSPNVSFDSLLPYSLKTRPAAPERNLHIPSSLFSGFFFRVWRLWDRRYFFIAHPHRSPAVKSFLHPPSPYG